MYIIACRAHFCHLLGLGQVGHSPRETSQSDGTLNRGPCLALVRQVTLQGEPVGVLGPWTGAQCDWAPSPLATPNASLTPLHPWLPLIPQHPMSPPMLPFATYTPSGPWVMYTPASPPNTPLTPPTPLMPLTALNIPRRPQCPLIHLYPFWLLSTYTSC